MTHSTPYHSKIVRADPSGLPIFLVWIPRQETATQRGVPFITSWMSPLYGYLYS
jgi:hypothetical protein